MGQVKDGNDLAQLIELLAHRTGTLLNVTQLAKALGHTRATVERHLAMLEKLFLIRTLPAWHRNAGKRLIKSPKIHVCDSGVAATLSDLHADHWLQKRGRFGHLLESFIVQQLVSQAGATPADLRFWHYRDKDQVEVDCVMTRGRKVWGVEVKAARSVTDSDTRGLCRLAEIAGSDFQGGIVFYDGEKHPSPCQRVLPRRSHLQTLGTLIHFVHAWSAASIPLVSPVRQMPDGWANRDISTPPGAILFKPELRFLPLVVIRNSLIFICMHGPNPTSPKLDLVHGLPAQRIPVIRVIPVLPLASL